jgi:stalled ribosome rescue protein Dom34
MATLMITKINQKQGDGAATPVSLHQAIVWIDDNEARIMRVDEGIHHDSTIHAPNNHDAPKQPAGNGGVADDSHMFFEQVARALDSADEILIVGPSATKEAFVKFMHKNDHTIDPRILGVETITHPDDKELAGFAKLYFTVGGPRRTGNGSGYRVTG